MFFTVEETNLMCCFDTSSRKKLIAGLSALKLNGNDVEMEDLIRQTVRKLEVMTDDQFEAAYIEPAEFMD